MWTNHGHSPGFSLLCLWTLGFGFWKHSKAACPDEVWSFVVRVGVELDSSIHSDEREALKNANIPLLRQGPARLRFLTFPEWEESHRNRLQLDFLTESYASVGGERFGAACESWSFNATPDWIQGGRSLLLTEWMNLFYQKKVKTKGGVKDVEDQELDSLLHAFWSENP